MDETTGKLTPEMFEEAVQRVMDEAEVSENYLDTRIDKCMSRIEDLALSIRHMGNKINDLEEQLYRRL